MLWLLGLFAVGAGVWGHLQKRRADKAESKANEGKINEIHEQAKKEVQSTSLDDLIAETNSRFPGDSTDPNNKAK